jgi:hypothetical protein
MLFSKQPGTPRPTARRYDYSGHPDTAKWQGTTLPIFWPMRQLYRERHTRFALCCHAREHTSGKESTLNGRKNGTTQAAAPICVRSTTHCRPNTPDGSTALCLEIELLTNAAANWTLLVVNIRKDFPIPRRRYVRLW